MTQPNSRGAFALVSPPGAKPLILRLNSLFRKLVVGSPVAGSHVGQPRRAAVARREAPLENYPRRGARREALVRDKVELYQYVQQRQQDGPQENLLVDVNARGARAAQQVERGLEDRLRHGPQYQVQLRSELGVGLERVDIRAEPQVAADFVGQVEAVQNDDVSKGGGKCDRDEGVFPPRESAQRRRIQGLGEVVEGNSLEASLRVKGVRF
jgi:hypothetical protein